LYVSPEELDVVVMVAASGVEGERRESRERNAETTTRRRCRSDLSLSLASRSRQTMLPQLSLSRSLFSLARRLEFELLFVSATGALLFIIINLEVRRKARRVRDEGCVFVFRSSEPQRVRIDRFDRPRPSLSQLGLLRLPLFFSLTSLSPASPPPLSFSPPSTPKQFGFRATSEL